jgi:integrase
MATSKTTRPFRTAREVEQSRPADTQYERADALTPGHRLRVYPTGQKVYLARLKATDGKTRYMTLGTVDDVTLADARAAVQKLQQDRRDTGDPIAAARQKKANELAALRAAEQEAKADALTVTKLFDRFLEAREKANELPALRDRTARDYRRSFDADLKPKIGSVPAAKLTSSQIRAVIRKKAEAHPTTAIHALAALRSCYSWATEEELVPSNPCKAVKQPRAGEPRERTLSVAELKALLRGLPAGMDEDVSRAVQVILHTGQRPGEVLGMTWAEIEGDVWTIPADRYKTKQAHSVALSPQVIALLGERTAGPVFPRRQRDKAVGPLRGDTAVKQFQEALKKLKVAPAGLHDLRRTFESRLVDTLKRDPFFVHHDLTGHKRPGLMATYQRVTNLDQRREAMQAWSDWLTGLAAENVVQFAAAAGEGEA